MKKALIIILVVLILLLGAAWAYLLLNGTPENLADVRTTLFGASDTNFPTGSEAGVATETPFEETPTDHIVPVSALLAQITKRAVAGAMLTPLDTSTSVRYVEKGTGHVYSLDLSTGREGRLSGRTVPNVVSAYWAPNGQHVVLITDRDGIRGETLLGTLTESDLETETLAPIDNIAFSRDSALLYFTEKTPSLGTRASVYNLETKTASVVFTVPFGEATVLWDIWDKEEHYVYTKPAQGFMGYLYKVAGGGLEKIDESLHLTVSRPDAQTVIINKNSNTGPYSLMLTLENGLGLFLSNQTLSEKCGATEQAVICAANAGMNNSAFPFAWYQGSVSYTDMIYRIDRTTGESTQMSDLEALSREQIDVSDLIVTNDGRAIFRNKRDDTLWLYNLPQ